MSEESNEVVAKVAQVNDKVNSLNGKVDGIVDKVIGLVADHPWEKWLEVANKYIGLFIPAVIAIAGLLAAVIGFCSAVRHDARVSEVAIYFMPVLTSLFAMHLAPKALTLVSSLVSKSEVESVRPELLYIGKVLLGLGGLVLGLYALLFEDVKAGLVLMALASIVIIALSHPAIVGIKPAVPTNTVEELITLCILPLKIVLVMMPIIVALATIGGLGYGIYVAIDFIGEAGASVLWGASVLPLAAPLAVYFYTLVLVFVLDISRAVASIPRKLDELKK